MLNDFISLFFPNYCQACYQPLARGENLICLKCITDLPRTDYHMFYDNPVRLKLQNLNKLRLAISFVKFVKGGKIQRLLHKLKYERQPEIGQILGFWYGNELKSALVWDADIIIPVPLHPAKLRKRGYNQSAHFAIGLSRALQIPWNDQALIRTARSETQTRKSKADRWMNVSGIFQVKKPELIRDLHVLLVDDVITTGSTIEACATEIEKHCKTLSIATIATAQ